MYIKQNSYSFKKKYDIPIILVDFYASLVRFFLLQGSGQKKWIRVAPHPKHRNIKIGRWLCLQIAPHIHQSNNNVEKALLTIFSSPL